MVAFRGAASAVTSLSSPHFDASHVNISCTVSTHSCKGSRQPFTRQRAAIKTHDGCFVRPPSSRCFDADFQQAPQIMPSPFGAQLVWDVSRLLLSAAPDVLRHSAAARGLRSALLAAGRERKRPNVAPRPLGINKLEKGKKILCEIVSAAERFSER